METAGTLVLRREEIVQNLMIFLYLFCLKYSATATRNTSILGNDWSKRATRLLVGSFLALYRLGCNELILVWSDYSYFLSIFKRKWKCLVLYQSTSTIKSKFFKNWFLCVYMNSVKTDYQVKLHTILKMF